MTSLRQAIAAATATLEGAGVDSARTDAETKVRWKLSPAGASGDPS